MPFIPHTEADVKAMLAAIGVASIDQLFEEIPERLRAGKLTQVPEGLSEMDVARLMTARANQDGSYLNFLGAGAYEHHIPAAVWEIVTRGEFYSAYTPYQAEASQGTLQLLYEYQTMMASLTGMDVSNASLYEGASGLAEAVLMAVRAHKKARKVLMPSTVHPIYRRVVEAIVRNQNIELVEIPHCPEGGHTIPEALKQYAGGEFAALVIPQPNFFGVLEEVDALTDWAHANNMLAIGLVNPTALAVLTPPGEWGAKGADIAVGEGQPLGAPLSSGGPYFGFMCCKQALVRQMPGAHHRRDPRQGRQARFHAHVTGARTAYPPLEGDLEHLHQPGADGDRRHYLYDAARARGSGARGGGESRQHAGAGGETHGHQGCHACFQPSGVPRGGAAARHAGV